MEIEDEIDRKWNLVDGMLDLSLLQSQTRVQAVREGSRKIREDLAMLSIRAAAMTLKEMYTDEDMKNMKGKVMKLIEYLTGKIPWFSEVDTADQIRRYEEIIAKNTDDYVGSLENYDFWCYNWCLLVEKLADYWATGEAMAQRPTDYYVERINERLKEM